MPTFDAPAGYRPFIPDDPDGPRREARLRQLGLIDGPDEEFDAFAAQLAKDAATLTRRPTPPYAMVNLITRDQQFFAGLYTPDSPPVTLALDTAATPRPAVGRTMAMDEGFCPHLLNRGDKALPLHDVFAYPRFSGNRVIDELGIRTYLGAALLDVDGTALGTVCVIDTEPTRWGQAGLHLIKDRAAQMSSVIRKRATPTT
jgi:GAF domain